MAGGKLQTFHSIAYACRMPNNVKKKKKKKKKTPIKKNNNNSNQNISIDRIIHYIITERIIFANSIDAREMLSMLHSGAMKTNLLLHTISNESTSNEIHSKNLAIT